MMLFGGGRQGRRNATVSQRCSPRSCRKPVPVLGACVRASAWQTRHGPGGAGSSQAAAPGRGRTRCRRARAAAVVAGVDAGVPGLPCMNQLRYSPVPPTTMGSLPLCRWPWQACVARPRLSGWESKARGGGCRFPRVPGLPGAPTGLPTARTNLGDVLDRRPGEVMKHAGRKLVAGLHHIQQMVRNAPPGMHRDLQ